MKKGCFVKSVVVLTIFIAAILYLIQNHLDTIVKPGKKIIKNLALTDIEDNLAYVKSSPEKDSLLVLFDDYLSKKLDKIKNLSEKNGDKTEINVDELLDQIKPYIINDSIIDAKELSEIKTIIKEDLK